MNNHYECIIGDSNSTFINLDGFTNLAQPGIRAIDLIGKVEELGFGDRLIIGVGVNDSATIKDLSSGGIIGPDLDKFKSSYSTLLDLAKAKFNNVIAVGLVCSDQQPTVFGNAEIRYSNKAILEFNKCIKALCKSKGVDFVDILPYFLGSEEELLDDHIHPNKKGQQIIIAELNKILT